jgi:tRNA-dihydrouridine synthase
MGAILLRKPRSLAKLVNGLVKESELPVTVKIRSGTDKVSVC